MRWAGSALFVGAAVLLLSFGGAIFAAPVTVPLMYVVVRAHPTRAFRIAGATIGGLTGVEVGWAVAYGLFGESAPIILVTGALFGIGIATTFVTTTRRADASLNMTISCSATHQG